jgi:1-acyl-sn-glycerol-3-phosphate acyltransferase
MRPPGMRDRFRQTRRLALMGLWTILCYMAWLPGALLFLPSGRLAQAWNDRMLRLWTLGLVTILEIRVEVEGLAPAKPFFLVANHLSYIDILVLGSRLGNTFVSKHELGAWPVLGHLARVTGTIFVNRTRKRDALRVLGEIDRAIARGAGVVLFPEGTSSSGDRIHPLKTALLEWAARRNYPVHVATLRYATDDPLRPASDAVCWWGDATFAPHLLQLLTVRRIRAHITFAPDPVVEPDRGRLAARLYATLETHFTPVAAGERAEHAPSRTA